MRGFSFCRDVNDAFTVQAAACSLKVGLNKMSVTTNQRCVTFPLSEDLKLVPQLTTELSQRRLQTQSMKNKHRLQSVILKSADLYSRQIWIPAVATVCVIAWNIPRAEASMSPFNKRSLCFGHLSFSQGLQSNTLRKKVCLFFRWYNVCTVRSLDPLCPLTVAVSKPPHINCPSWQCINGQTASYERFHY
jgi:hypothetical protein